MLLLPPHPHFTSLVPPSNMALSERDRNRITGKTGDKRKKVEIDLTGDSDDEAPQPKV